MGQFRKYLDVEPLGCCDLLVWGGGGCVADEVNARPVDPSTIFVLCFPFKQPASVRGARHSQDFTAPGRTQGNDSWCRSIPPPASSPRSRLLSSRTVSRLFRGVEPILSSKGLSLIPDLASLPSRP